MAKLTQEEINGVMKAWRNELKGQPNIGSKVSLSMQGLDMIEDHFKAQQEEIDRLTFLSKSQGKTP